MAIRSISIDQAANGDDSPRSRLNAFLRLIPIALLGVWLAVVYLQPARHDLELFFVPAGEMVAAGVDPYVQVWRGPFVYPPFSLWFFVLLSHLPWVALWYPLLSACLLYWMLRRLEASHWWLLYPPALLAIALGQLDIPVLCLSLYAATQRPLRSGVLMAIAFAIKPTVAVFFFPLWLSEDHWRRRVIALLLVSLSLVLLSSGLPWVSWFQAVTSQMSHFVDEGASVVRFAIPLMPLLLILGFVDRKNSREWIALSLPASRFYSLTGLIGGMSPIAILFHLIVRALMMITGLPLGFLEPVLRMLFRRFYARLSSIKSG